ncbi:MAG: sugar phosphate isomerase/epimerase family protein [Planctomycetota bacterium]|jgi:sugar phosphate isomerase/epimerase
MAEVILNTIAIEPNRFKRDATLASDIERVLPRIKAAGFDGLEVWQYHVSGKSDCELESLKESADRLSIELKVLGAYPKFHLVGEEGKAEAENIVKLLDTSVKLGIPLIKFFFGSAKADKLTIEEKKLTEESFKVWAAAAAEKNIRLCAELHGNTFFDPVDNGEKFMQDNPEIEFGVCYQPYNFFDTNEAVLLADRFAGKIDHIHLQGRDNDMQSELLEESVIDYEALIHHLNKVAPNADLGIEFVKDCGAAPEEFDLEKVLNNASEDAEYVRSILCQ